ncbi:LysR substrate-binding domain-containing protein [Biostraticola tofi]|uniref:LysR substrate binding domain-containing protein n=1 Tax=Biostraticola tofi TaxID=466109 RepID=A0A4R3YPL2_9GAMM|nr:LysR substrate-binding domain-containing protein [Biostraticola tofi]TCV93518.1 LysR substrate binding domain-containing protein [Biostraticola tofi]
MISWSIKPVHSLLDAAVGGMGIAYLATWLAAEPIDNAKLTVLTLSIPSADLPITALWPRSRDLAPKVRVIGDALVSQFVPLTPWDRRFKDNHPQ